MLALAIIVVLFPLALFGALGLAGVVLVHEIAEVFVILNGVRAAQRPAALRARAATPNPPASDPPSATTTSPIWSLHEDEHDNEHEHHNH